jgi:hypothetical protein
LGRALWVDSRLGWYGDSELDSRALKLFLEDGQSVREDRQEALETRQMLPTV